MADSIPEAFRISHDHKAQMTAVIRGLLPASSRTAKADAQAIAIAIDGAIISVQLGTEPNAALRSLGRIVNALDTARK
jgi:hypothetical protein